MIYIEGLCPYKIDITKTQVFKYPPTVNRFGNTKSPYDLKTVITIHTDLVKEPLLITSDLHSHTETVLNDLDSIIDISKYTVITLGDMAGIGVYGSDGDPTEFYERINKKTNLYIIQGNHDLPPNDIDRLHQLKNKDGSNCYLSDGEEIVNTPNGTMAGVHGTISLKEHPYKKHPDLFYPLLENVLKWKKPDFILTHETPEIPIINPESKKQKSLIGKKELFDIIIKYKPKVHMYGHCHHPYVMSYVNDVLFINADSRIILLEPIK
jgi:Icc-related predicted phosphoesterase